MKNGIGKRNRRRAVVRAIYYGEAGGTAKNKGTAKADGVTVCGIVKNILKESIWLSFHLLLFALVGALVTVLLDDSARNALFGMLSL